MSYFSLSLFYFSLFYVFAINANDLQIAGVNFTLFDNVLKQHVSFQENATTVDYKNLSKSIEFKIFIQQIQKANLSLIQTKEQWAAFWLNTYNALVLNTILKNPCKTDLFGSCGVLDSIEQIGEQQPSAVLVKAFSRIVGMVAGKDTTLDEVEQQLAKPNITYSLNIFRIYYPLCIVKAAISSPNLLNRAYSPTELQSQMDQVALQFISHPTKGSSYDPETKQLRISKIFLEYGFSFIDLVEPDTENRSVLWFLIPYFERFMEPKIIQEIRSNFISINETIDYFEFDWKLNGDVTSLCDGPIRPCFPWWGMLFVVVLLMVLVSFVICGIMRRREKRKTIFLEVHFEGEG